MSSYAPNLGMVSGSSMTVLVVRRLLAVLHQQHDQPGLLRTVQRQLPSHLLAHRHLSLEPHLPASSSSVLSPSPASAERLGQSAASAGGRHRRRAGLSAAPAAPVSTTPASNHVMMPGDRCHATSRKLMTGRGGGRSKFTE